MRRGGLCGVDFAMGVGGAFDVLAGELRRAPRILQAMGLEWAWRWAQEPRRLAPRYGLDGARFAWTTLRRGPSIATSRRPSATEPSSVRAS